MQLYGRHPTIADTESTTLDTSSCQPYPQWAVALNAWKAEVYANPNSPKPTVRLLALKALSQYLQAPTHRNVAETANLWCEALRVVNTGNSEDPSVESVSECAMALYSSGKYQLALQQTQRVLQGSCDFSLLSEEGYMSFIRLVSINVMCSVHQGMGVNAAINDTCVALLGQSKCRMSQLQSKEERIALTGSIEVLVWSYDWSDRFGGSPLPSSLKSTVVHLAPQWMGHLFDDGAMAERVSLSPLTPAQQLVAGRAAAGGGDYAKLKSLYGEALRRERRIPDSVIFNLTAVLGNLLLSLSHSSADGTASTVVQYVGTSLSPDNLIRMGNTLRGGKEAVNILTRMSGAGAYGALRSVLFHKTVAERTNLQEQFGDILTGCSTSNWQTALSAVMQKQSLGDNSWRRALPDTLRLLSDAGRHKEFFQLLTEYDPNESKSSLCVASALAQALRTTGDPDHYTDVVELIASSQIPKSDADDMFLKDACLQTMYLLRNSKRWEESIALYATLRMAMPPQAGRLLSSMLCEMPESSPWMSALQMLQENDHVAPEFLASLQCVRCGKPIPSHPQQRKHAIRALCSAGMWQPILEDVCTPDPSPDNWVAVLQAMERSSVAVSALVLQRIPPNVLFDKQVLMRLLLASLSNGWVDELSGMISGTESSLASDIKYLVHFLRTGTIQPGTQVRDSYIGHCYTSFASSSGFQVPILPAASAATCTRRVAQHYRVPEKCVTASKGEPGTFVLRPFPAHVVDLSQVLYTSDDLVVAMKPLGAAIQSIARGSLRHANHNGAYRIAPLLPPDSMGLFVLQRATSSPKQVFARLYLRMRLVPLCDSHTTLLSTKFFSKYRMAVVETPGDGTVTVAFTSSTDVPLEALSSVPRNIQLDLNAEGWSWVVASGAVPSYIVGGIDVVHTDRAESVSVRY